MGKKYPEKTLTQLYDSDKMPEGLKEAYRLNDQSVEPCYSIKPFNSDKSVLSTFSNCMKR
ncbi:MAG: hypothetical protein EBR24_08155 [Flavobacteriia bacterium]|nr:hypothetical protein [Flavobacteriia bacterium]